MNQTPREARLLVAKALRSGDYKQGSGCLEKKDISLETFQEDTFNCCLGVACREYIKAGGELETLVEDGNRTGFAEEIAYLPKKVQHWLGLGDRR